MQFVLCAQCLGWQACINAEIECPEELVGVDVDGLVIPDASAGKTAAMGRLIKAAGEQFVVKEAAAVSHRSFVCAWHLDPMQAAGADLATGSYADLLEKMKKEPKRVSHRVHRSSNTILL